MTTGRRAATGTPTNIGYKIVVLGDPYSGKTSIINRLTRKTFQSNYIKGIAGGRECREHVLSVNKVQVTIQIYDTVCWDDKRTLNKTIFRNVHGIMLVFDMSRPKTLNSIPEWIELIRTPEPSHSDGMRWIGRPFFYDPEIIVWNVPSYDPEMILVGNKSDIPHEQRPAGSDDMRQIAREIAQNSWIRYLEVSARLNENVQEVFQRLVRKITRNDVHFQKSLKLVPNSEETSSSCFI